MESSTRRPAWLLEDFGDSIPNLAVLAAKDGLDTPKPGFRPAGGDKIGDGPSPATPGKPPTPGRPPSKKKKRPTTRLARQMAIKYRISMTLEMRNTLMDCFLRCKRKGLMNMDKPAELKLVWSRVCGEMKEKYPGYAWTDTKIVAEFKTCKKRWQQWLNMSRRPGSTVGENGIIQAPESSWKWLLDRAPDAKWMRTESLGHIKVYEAVFNETVAAGTSEAEVSEEENQPEIIASAEVDDSPATHTTASAAPRKRQYNPDVNPRISEESDAADSPSSSSVGRPNKSARRLRSGSDAEVEALERLATSISRPMGSDDVIAAVNVIQKRLGNRLRVQEKVQAFQALANNPLNAVILQQVESDDEKVAFIRGLLG